MSNENYDEWKKRTFPLRDYQEEMIKQVQEPFFANRVRHMSGREREKLFEEARREIAEEERRQREIWATSNPMTTNTEFVRKMLELPIEEQREMIQGVWGSRETSLIQRAALARKPINLPYKVDADNAVRLMNLCALCSRKMHPLHVGSICDLCEQRRYVVSQNNERN